MKPFQGFPAKTGYTPLPNPFITSLLPGIEDLAELKVSLHLFRLLYYKKGYPRFITLGEMLREPDLVEGLGSGGEESLKQALMAVCRRGTFLTLTVAREGKPHELYFLNDPQGREAVGRITRGEVPLGEIAAPHDPPPPPGDSIFTIYEQNIGLITPLVAEELKAAEERYPAPWIEEAFREAVSHNKRRWSYVARILERWAEEGREGGKHGRGFEEDADRYARWRDGRTAPR
ncbi:MAG: DnaD domain protein [Dehalococcoidia bacterium]|nr:DnaD domain protein [Dehalococcoidia bacterium]